jgi:hypothetical protein
VGGPPSQMTKPAIERDLMRSSSMDGLILCASVGTISSVRRLMMDGSRWNLNLFGWRIGCQDLMRL